MSKYDLQKLNIEELRELLSEKILEIEDLQKKNKALEDSLVDHEFDPDSAGTLADTAAKMNDILGAAQKTADQYLENIRRVKTEQDSVILVRMRRAEERCTSMEEEMKQRCEDMERTTKERCRKMEQESNTRCTEQENEVAARCEKMLLDAKQHSSDLDMITLQECAEYEKSIRARYAGLEDACDEAERAMAEKCRLMEKEAVDRCDALEKQSQERCAAMEAAMEIRCESMRSETQINCDSMELESRRRCQAMEEEAVKKSEAYWTEISERLGRLYETQQSVKETEHVTAELEMEDNLKDEEFPDDFEIMG